MLLYALIWRVRAIDTATGLLAVLAGLALGLLALHVRFNIFSVIAVANPVEHLRAGSGALGINLPTTPIQEPALKFLSGLGDALAVHTFFLHPSHRPTL